MKINIFSVPLIIGNIDSNKIKLNNIPVKNTWESKTPSTFYTQNTFKDKESCDYLLKVIAKLLFVEFKKQFIIDLKNIWINKYKKNDYQEEHIHTDSNFSFIIYSKVKESNTVFLSRDKEIIESFKMVDLFEPTFEVPCQSNQIIIFPSFLRHRVKRVGENYETISGNITLNFN